MRYSFILPIRNRKSLLARGLQSIAMLAYDKREFEVIICDYMSTDRIEDVIKIFVNDINIKHVIIDPNKYRYGKVYMYNGKCNPALAQNIGANVASGSTLILSSPEIVHWYANLHNADGIEDLENKFVYGKVIEYKEKTLYDMHGSKVFYVINKLDSGKVLCDWKFNGIKLAVYFIGLISRRKFLDVGGIDESYMGGIAYEDEDFGNRMDRSEIELEYNPNICGVHLEHDRSYQLVKVIESNMGLFNKKKNDGFEKHIVANTGIVMGDTSSVVSIKEYPLRN